VRGVSKRKKSKSVFPARKGRENRSPLSEKKERRLAKFSARKGMNFNRVSGAILRHRITQQRRGTGEPWIHFKAHCPDCDVHMGDKFNL